MLTPSNLLSLKTSGSATGNPRNKCALMPGHSLMDWIRLGNSGVDLTGFKGRTVPVSGEELAKHNTRQDAWLAIRGKVFNVTRYMDFHPGGVEELMRGVGRDATKLFDEVHAWVNYQQLLNKCYIGPLKNVVKIDSNVIAALKTKAKSGLPPLPPPTEIVPRFDWIQKNSDITFYFYTKQDCNPGLVINYKSAKLIRILVQICNSIHQFEIELHADVLWPPKLANVNSETGKIEINLLKIEQVPWTTFGTMLTTKVPGWSTIDDEFGEVPFTFEVVANETFNHDSFELCLESKKNIIRLPVGYHVTISASINGQNVARSYTPVGLRFLPKPNAIDSNACLRFLIKNYKTNGLLSTHLAQLAIGCAVQLSGPKGGFTIKMLQCRKVSFLAAGSGITPCLSLLEYILSCRYSKIEEILLVYFNKTEDDIWCREEIEKLANTDERFHIVNVLSNPTTEWSGSKGHITTTLLTELFDKKYTNSENFVCVCGPSAFNNAAKSCLNELNFKDEYFHIFQG